MFMKIANARKNRNKGFSLIELIIVIAIMVALVAVMAPQFIKYVQKSRNAALKTAAEDYMAAVKVLYVDEEGGTYTKGGTINLTVTGGQLAVTSTDINDYLPAFNSAAGLGTTMPSMGKVTEHYTITITSSATGEYSFVLSSVAGA